MQGLYLYLVLRIFANEWLCWIFIWLYKNERQLNLFIVMLKQPILCIRNLVVFDAF